MIQQSLRVIYLTVGLVCLAIGTVGVFVPVLPTTPFVLLAAFFFSKSSRRLHGWLLSRPVLGVMIVEWRDHRVIRPRAKILAAATILLTFGATVIFVAAPLAAKSSVIVLGVALLTF
ncbi:MAG TPA: YbaN family protein, partial [Verrucomicrobiae bacterium]|nr:YbaN family protein [Verrucomicrobiae bacterium]